MKRLIAAVQIEDQGKAVKTNCFTSPVYIGDCFNIVKLLCEKGAQEIALLDLHASRTGKRNLDFIRRIAEEINVPFSYGGSVNSIHDVRELTNLGVEKFLISKFLGNNEPTIRRIIDFVGATSVSLSLDIVEYRTLENEVVVKLREAPEVEVELSELAATILELAPGELVIRLMSLDGEDNSKTLDLYSTIFDLGSIQDLYSKMQLIIGTGVRKKSIAQDLERSLKVDGFMVGSWTCFTERGGILTSYPEEYSIMQKRQAIKTI